LIENDQMAIDACQFYSKTGYAFPMSGGSCSATKGWCSTGNVNTKGSIGINSALSLNAPAPVASEAYSGFSLSFNFY
jgi:hypothetical protein